MSSRSVPLLLRPVFIRQILCYAITKKSRKQNSLLSLLKFGQVCSDWKNTILHYSSGTCLTVALPQSRLDFQRTFWLLCHSFNKAETGFDMIGKFEKFRQSKHQKMVLIEAFGSINTMLTSGVSAPVFIQLLRMMIKEWYSRGEPLGVSIIKLFNEYFNKSALRIAVEAQNIPLVKFLLFEAFTENKKNNDEMINLDLELVMPGRPYTSRSYSTLFLLNDYNILQFASIKVVQMKIWGALLEAFRRYARRIEEKNKKKICDGEEVKTTSRILSSRHKLWIQRYKENKLFSHDALALAPRSTLDQSFHKEDVVFHPLSLACCVMNHMSIKFLLEEANVDPNERLLPAAPPPAYLPHVSPTINFPICNCFRTVNNFSQQQGEEVTFPSEFQQRLGVSDKDVLLCCKLLVDHGVRTGEEFVKFACDRKFEFMCLADRILGRLCRTSGLNFQKWYFLNDYDDSSAFSREMIRLFFIDGRGTRAFEAEMMATESFVRICFSTPRPVSLQTLELLWNSILMHPEKSNELRSIIRNQLLEEKIKNNRFVLARADIAHFLLDVGLLSQDDFKLNGKPEELFLNQMKEIVQYFDNEPSWNAPCQHFDCHAKTELEFLKFFVERLYIRNLHQFSYFDERNGDSILHVMCRGASHPSRLESFKYLLENCCRDQNQRKNLLTFTNLEGMTPLDVARDTQHRIQRSRQARRGNNTVIAGDCDSSICDFLSTSLA